MKPRFILFCLLLLIASCSDSNSSKYKELLSHFPTYAEQVQHFEFTAEGLPDKVSVPIIKGIVRPLGKLNLGEHTTMLVLNDFREGEAPWGNVVGYIFNNETLTDSITLALDFSNTSMTSIISEELILSFEQKSMQIGEEGPDEIVRWKMRFNDRKSVFEEI